ncbi:MAG: HAMP domain-containing sensor histidine kinase [Pseudomonadota bacterium]
MMLRQGNLWRSMPIRLALLLVGLFAFVSLAGLAASYAVTQRSFEQSIRADLRQDLAGFRAAPSARAVALLVEAESRAADPNRLILSYVAPGGRIYGNGAIARDDAGFHIFSLDRARTEYDGTYLSLTDRLHGGLITIARSRAEIVALRDVFVNILWVSLVPTVLIALSGGLILARRSTRHVEMVSASLDKMTSGDLAARTHIGKRWSDDLRQIGEKLNKMAAAQEAVVASLRQVSSDIAHDLKTPLQRLALYLDDLDQQLRDQDISYEILEKARAEVQDMGTIFQSLLQLARVEAGSPKARFEKVDLSAIVHTVTDLFEPSVRAGGQRLDVFVDETVPSMLGDRGLLGQMLSNLIENAMRHASGSSYVSVTLKRMDDHIVLCVSDAGLGIPDAERERVFDRLYRLDRSRHTPGYGLGLSLVAAVATLHDAHVSLRDNAPGLQVILRFQAHADTASHTDV